MAQRLSHWANAFPWSKIYNSIFAMVAPIADRISSQITVSGALAIKAGASALARTTAAITFVAGGRHGSLAAGDMPALTGLVIAANRFNVAVFYVNAAGVLSVRFGTEGATAGAVVFPEAVPGAACIGYLLITHSSTFTGGTTALDAATTVYINTVGPFDPTIIV